MFAAVCCYDFAATVPYFESLRLVCDAGLDSGPGLDSGSSVGAGASAGASASVGVVVRALVRGLRRG